MKQLIFPLSKKEAADMGVAYSSDQNRDALFPSRLRELRAETKISQAVLAEELNVTKSTVSLYEQGDTVPDVKILTKMADYYKVSLDYLVGKTNIKGTTAYELLDNQLTDWEKILDEMPPLDQSNLVTRLTHMFNTDDDYEKMVIRSRLFDVLMQIDRFVGCYRATKTQILQSCGVETKGDGILNMPYNEEKNAIANTLIFALDEEIRKGYLKNAVDILMPYFENACKDLIPFAQKELIELIHEMTIGIRDFSLTTVPALSGAAYNGYAVDDDKSRKAKEFLTKVKEAEKNGDDKKA